MVNKLPTKSVFNEMCSYAFKHKNSTTQTKRKIISFINKKCGDLVLIFTQLSVVSLSYVRMRDEELGYLRKV